MPPQDLLYQRAYKACFACRETKNKCILIEDSSGSARLQCRRCKRQQRECVFPVERYWTGPETKRGRAPTRHQQRGSSARSVREVIEADRLSSSDALSGFSSAESREGSEQPYARDIYFKDPTPSRSITPFGVWNSFPGVRMGWLSAEEAMIFVNYFFQNLAPWSIVPMQRLADPIDYGMLVGEEPLLAPTVLMISSRYHSLPGSSGQARANFIHNKLWERCQGLLLDIILGQGPKGIARSIGTIEALLLMIEWHPGSLHSHGIESEDGHMSQESEFGLRTNSTASPGAKEGDVGDVVWRSGRMSWILLGCANALSQEIGLRDSGNCEIGYVPTNEDILSHQTSNIPLQKKRLSQASLLLRILKHQIAFRQGLKLHTSPFMGYARPQGPGEDVPTPHSKIMAAWVDINQVERRVTEYQMKPNGGAQSQGTANPSPIQLVSYVELSLAEWLSEYPEFHSCYDSCTMSAIMLEYHYVRAYVYSLALPDDPMHIMSGHGRVTIQSSHTDPGTSEETITDAIVTSTSTFFQILCRLGDSGELKYAPDRVFVRTAGASVLLLKAVSFPPLSMQTDKYLNMVSSIARVLRENAVDSLHLCTHYADFLDTQVQAHRRQQTYGQTQDLDNAVRELFQVQV
ncbi:hypothetical protein BDV24DRAFT_170461 [Aspergillus arachidicola]|uniref:Zn(2)-C6 fungal-type domain-containing protein n=1 Tax=Aspergillus arachidicola TaxID=656916 RepID=A0A5N6XRF6_9EURO|nr:hypothetical protein BDV24DRAFT_170461 [Aspergillus arachidicola]